MSLFCQCKWWGGLAVFSLYELSLSRPFFSTGPLCHGGDASFPNPEPLCFSFARDETEVPTDIVHWLAPVITKYRCLGCLSNRNLFIHRWSLRKSKIVTPVRLVSTEGSLLGLQRASFPLCPHSWKCCGVCFPLLTRTLVLLDKGPTLLPLWPCL
jgi:hypothetical protein